MAEQPNVFVLSVDSLSYSWFANSSQELAELVGGVNFTNAISPASYTSSAMPAINTGKYTDEIDAWGLPESGEPAPVAEEFEKAGYDCGLWTDNYLFGSEYNYDRGFSAGNRGQPGRKKQIVNAIKNTPLNSLFGLFEAAYFNVIEPVLALGGEEKSFYRSANSLNKEALDWLEVRKSNAPIFCWLHYMDTHHPYQPPEKYLNAQSFHEYRSQSKLGEFTRNAIKSNGESLTDEELEDLKASYRACCDYIRDELTNFITTVKDRGYFNPGKDIVVITADHGEILDRERYGMLGHVPPAFWDDIVRVPFIVGCPQWPNSTDDNLVSLIDLKHILTNISGIRGETSLWPSDISRDHVFMVSEWEEPENGSITTFQGVRAKTGEKCFGLRRFDEDRIVYTDINDLEEKVMETHDLDDCIEERNLTSIHTDLYSEIRERGDVVKYQSGNRSIGYKANEDHLRDLGYLD
ncbi:sulfatase-like hydrolase/transferase [Natronosalvus halobius]|uniref:sulfatase-like hydrolase/transferase n=1 Tax=Natronosalvus halobius TaxID=2953746 RepID=UPI0020A1CE8F|nr:sulfatase-like hydrolase/transferase [Natronosalvus halobius]USZ71472.1 sulfatase-like hydrolase/transferase [Natronosalvus halobius]